MPTEYNKKYTYISDKLTELTGIIGSDATLQNKNLSLVVLKAAVDAMKEVKLFEVDGARKASENVLNALNELKADLKKYGNNQDINRAIADLEASVKDFSKVRAAANTIARAATDTANAVIQVAREIASFKQDEAQNLSKKISAGIGGKIGETHKKAYDTVVQQIGPKAAIATLGVIGLVEGSLAISAGLLAVATSPVWGPIAAGKALYDNTNAETNSKWIKEHLPQEWQSHYQKFSERCGPKTTLGIVALASPLIATALAGRKFGIAAKSGLKNAKQNAKIAATKSKLQTGLFTQYGQNVAWWDQKLGISRALYDSGMNIGVSTTTEFNPLRALANVGIFAGAFATGLVVGLVAAPIEAVKRRVLGENSTVNQFAKMKVDGFDIELQKVDIQKGTRMLQVKEEDKIVATAIQNEWGRCNFVIAVDAITSTTEEVDATYVNKFATLLEKFVQAAEKSGNKVSIGANGFPNKKTAELFMKAVIAKPELANAIDVDIDKLDKNSRENFVEASTKIATTEKENPKYVKPGLMASAPVIGPWVDNRTDIQKQETIEVNTTEQNELSKSFYETKEEGQKLKETKQHEIRENSLYGQFSKLANKALDKLREHKKNRH